VSLGEHFDIFDSVWHGRRALQVAVVNRARSDEAVMTSDGFHAASCVNTSDAPPRAYWSTGTS
jgi:hypothetical protein